MRAIAQWMAPAAVGLLGSMMAACGGGSGASAPPPPPMAQSAGGLWQGQFTTAGGASVEGSALVGENGALFSQVDDPALDCANVMTGTLSVSGTSVSGNVVLSLVSDIPPEVAARGCTFPDGSSVATGTVSGSIAERATLTLTPKLTTADGTALPSSSLNLSFNGAIYDTPASLPKIAGTYSGPSGAVTSISTGGSISVGYPDGCTVTGTVAVINPDYDAYSVSGSYAGCPSSSAAYNGATVTGLLAAIGTVTNAPLFGGYALVANGHATNALGAGTALAPPSNLSYTGTTTFTLGMAGSVLSPRLSGSANVWSISPALPAGLTLDAVSGLISGTPTAVSAAATYTVTARNGAGSTTATVQILVQEISASVSQYGLTGQVQVAAAPFSKYGIVSVGATIDGQSLGTLTAPNECFLPGQPVRVCNGNYYAFTLDAAALGSGTHTLVYIIVDANGVTDKVSQQVVINNPPVLSFTPADGAIVFGTLSVSGRVTTDKAGVGISTTVSFDGTQIGSSSSGSITVTYALTGIVPGTHQLAVVSTDSTGAATTVDELITVASAANLVYAPLATVGQLLAVDPTTAVYSGLPAAGAPTSYYLQSGSHAVALQGITSSFDPTQWIVSGGLAYASGNAKDRPSSNLSVYAWSASGAITNLSSAAQSTGVMDLLNAVHGGWVLWQSDQSSFELFQPASAQKYLLAMPSGATALDGDFYVGGSGPVVYFSANASPAGQLPTGSIYRWTSGSGTSSPVYSNGETNTGVRTDGVRVAWDTTPPGELCNAGQGCALTALDIASSSTQQLSTDLQPPYFFLADGVAAWDEGSGGSVGAIKDSPSAGAAVQMPASGALTQLYGTGGGYVLYAGTDGKLYAWNAALASARLLFDATPVSAMISGKTVWFTTGNLQALYQVALP